MAEARTDVNDQSFNVDVVRQIDIHDRDAMKRFHSRFINANELTLTEDFDASHSSILDNFHRIIPLRQLTHLNLQCRHLSFEHLIELLYWTPHIHTLELPFTPMFSKNCTFMQENSLLQLVSDTNVVTSLTIATEITLKELQYLGALFPRLESLTMKFHQGILEPIMSFLLSKTNKKTHRLSSLCILRPARVLMTTICNRIELERSLQYYSVKQMNQKLYIWW